LLRGTTSNKSGEQPDTTASGQGHRSHTAAEDVSRSKSSKTARPQDIQASTPNTASSQPTCQQPRALKNVQGTASQCFAQVSRVDFCGAKGTAKVQASEQFVACIHECAGLLVVLPSRQMPGNRACDAPSIRILHACMHTCEYASFLHRAGRPAREVITPRKFQACRSE